MVVCSICGAIQLPMNLNRHEGKCQRFSSWSSSSSSSSSGFQSSVTISPNFDNFQSTTEYTDFLENEETGPDSPDMSPILSLRAKRLLLLRHFFGVPTDSPVTLNTKSNKYIELFRILKSLPKISLLNSISEKPESYSNFRSQTEERNDSNIMRLISELCPTRGKLKDFSKILEMAQVVSNTLKLTISKLKDRTTKENFHSVQVWHDRLFYYRRLDDVLRDEVFGDLQVDSRLTWNHPGARSMRYELSIQLESPGSTPVGLVFWSDSASPSNWSSVSFHPIMLRLINDPLDQYTLVGMIPTSPQSSKKSHVSSFKLCMIQRCWKVLFSTLPLRNNQPGLSVFRSSKNRWVTVRPWVFGFLGDLPELDGLSCLIQNQSSCRTCLAKGESMNPLRESCDLRNLEEEHSLCEAIKQIGKSDGAFGRITAKHEMIDELKKINRQPIPSILTDPRIRGFPIPTIEDLYHHCEGGVLENLKEHIFTVIQDEDSTEPNQTRLFEGDWNNYVSSCLRILSQKRFRYPGQHVMAQGYERSKKFGNFNARYSLSQDLPFMLHSIVRNRNNKGLLLMISYVCFRNMLQILSADQFHLEVAYDKVRKIFCYLYSKLISPKLSVGFHPKIHRIGCHMNWKELVEYGSFHRFACKTGEANLQPLKAYWNLIGGSSDEEFVRAVTRKINLQVNSNIDRPLHVTISEETPRTMKKSLSLFQKMDISQVTEENRDYLNLFGVDNRPSKCRMKIRLNRNSTFFEAKTISRDSFIWYISSDGTETGGVLLEIVYQSTTHQWICMVLEYKFCFFDHLLFNLPFWEKTSNVKLLQPEKILKQVPMIPDFGACFRAHSVGIHPSPVWLRTHLLLDSPAINTLVELPSDSLPSSSIEEFESPETFLSQSNEPLDEIINLMRRMTLNNYVQTTDPQEISETLTQLNSIAQSTSTLASGVNALKIRIKAQLLEALKEPASTQQSESANTSATITSRSKRVRRPPTALDDYHRS